MLRSLNNKYLLLAVIALAGSSSASADSFMIKGDCLASAAYLAEQDFSIKLQVAPDATEQSLGNVALQSEVDGTASNGIPTGTVDEYSFGNIPVGTYKIVCETCCPPPPPAAQE